jgi:hypothetical protein
MNLKNTPSHSALQDTMGRRRRNCIHPLDMNEPSMQRPNDLSKSHIVLKQDSTSIAVSEMSLSS